MLKKPKKLFQVISSLGVKRYKFLLHDLTTYNLHTHTAYDILEMDSYDMQTEYTNKKSN